MEHRVSDMQWVLAQSQTAEYAFILRFCELPADFPRERFPVRLNLFWKAAQPTQAGMPSRGDLERMEAFEERIIAATESDGIAALPMVLTGRGEREYVIYVRSADEFLQRLTDMPQEDEPYPIEIHCSDDAGWDYYDAEVASTRSDGSD